MRIDKCDDFGTNTQGEIIVRHYKCQCCSCGTWIALHDAWADLDGEAFKAYYCRTCAESELRRDTVKPNRVLTVAWLQKALERAEANLHVVPKREEKPRWVDKTIVSVGVTDVESWKGLRLIIGIQTTWTEESRLKVGRKYAEQNPNPTYTEEGNPWSLHPDDLRYLLNWLENNPTNPTENTNA